MDTVIFLGWQSIPRAMAITLVFVLAVLYLKYSGAGNQVVTDQLEWAKACIAAAAILFIPTFLFNLARAPYLLDKEKQKKLDELSGRTAPDIDIVVTGDVGVLVPKNPNKDPNQERDFYLIVVVDIINRSDQGATINIRAKLKSDTVQCVCSATRTPISGLEQEQLRPLINVGIKESISGILLFSMNLDILEQIGAGNLENLQKHKFYLEIYDEITKMDRVFPKGWNIRL